MTIPQAPAWLQRNARAHERWQRLWTEVNLTRIKPMHYDLMCQYCLYYSDMRDAAEKMERGKLVAEKKQVGTKADVTIERITVTPYQGIFDSAVREMSRLGQLLGLQPDRPMTDNYNFADYADTLLIDDEYDEAAEEGSDGPDDCGLPSGDDGVGAAQESGTGYQAVLDRG